MPSNRGHTFDPPLQTQSAQSRVDQHWNSWWNSLKRAKFPSSAAVSTNACTLPILPRFQCGRDACPSFLKRDDLWDYLTSFQVGSAQKGSQHIRPTGIPATNQRMNACTKAKGKADEFCGPYPKKIGATYKGRRMKQGRLGQTLGSAATHAYVNTKRNADTEAPTQFISIVRRCGCYADKEDEEQDPHEEPVFKPSKPVFNQARLQTKPVFKLSKPVFNQARLQTKPVFKPSKPVFNQAHLQTKPVFKPSKAKEPTKKTPAEGPLSNEDQLTELSEVNSETDDYRKGHGLHHSQLATNLSIDHLRKGFQREAIQKRLKLLEADRDDRDRDRDGKKELVLEKVKLLESIREGDKVVEMKLSFSDEDGVAAERIGSCSTCENFLDALECSKPENQRKSLRQFKLKDLEELEMARKNLELDLGIKVERSSSDSENYEATHGLHHSKLGLNLSITNLGDDFKRKRILEKLRLLEANLEEESSHIGSRVVRFSGANKDVAKEANDQADEADRRLRSCSTCRDSLDALECKKPENQRKSLAHWTAKGLDVIKMTKKQLDSELSNEDSYNDTDDIRSRSKSTPTNLGRGKSSHHNSTIADAEDLFSFGNNQNKMNHSVQDLISCADLKKKKKNHLPVCGIDQDRILEKLKLLETKKLLQLLETKSSAERTPKIKFYEDDDGEKAGANESPNLCSTCEGSLDALDCSKPNNQCKSLALLENKCIEDIELAVMRLEKNDKSSLGFSENRWPIGSEGDFCKENRATSRARSSLKSQESSDAWFFSCDASGDSNSLQSLSEGQSISRFLSIIHYDRI